MSTSERTMFKILRRLLSVRRPYGSRAEGQVITDLVHQFGAVFQHSSMHVDAAGNLHLDVRGGRSTTLFVAHVDTAHRTEGANVFDDSKPMWTADGKHPLGADDGAGVALIATMALYGVPGYYVFTRGEERGGRGARHLAQEQYDLLAQFDRAIAFDRRDTVSVITHQGMGRCCSDLFAEALSTAFNDRGLLFMPDDTGVYTDTAEFVEVIPECTNVSVGYYNEHTGKESLDTDHLRDLLRACLFVDWESLPTSRDPLDEDDEYDTPGWGAGVPTEFNDPFAWKDDRGELRTGSGHAAREPSHARVVYREFELRVNKGTRGDGFVYSVLTPDQQEYDYGFGFCSHDEAISEARAAVDQLLEMH